MKKKKVEKIEGMPVTEIKKEVIEQVKEEKKQYVVRESFFYKGMQFHRGQDIGFSEELQRIGKIEIKEEDEF